MSAPQEHRKPLTNDQLRVLRRMERDPTLDLARATRHLRGGAARRWMQQREFIRALDAAEELQRRSLRTRRLGANLPGPGPGHEARDAEAPAIPPAQDDDAPAPIDERPLSDEEFHDIAERLRQGGRP